jgi:2-oxoglutarate dehydrogenase E2 component (dihydrolipoamide succinyltransferase)
MTTLVDIILPPDHPKDADSVVERWLRKPGERVRLHEPLLEINTDKAVVEIAAPADGVLQEILKNVNDPVRPGDVLGRIGAGAASATLLPEGGPEIRPARQSASTADVPTPLANELSPAVRQLLRQHGLDPSQIPGSGRGGRITVDDVQSFLKHQSPAAAEPPHAQRVAHSPLRRRIAQHMVESMLKTAPHVTAVFEADLSAVVAHRDQHKAEFQQRGLKLTYTAYFVAAAVRALKEVPEINSRWHDDALELFSDCNIGVATAVPGGLLVPVIGQAQKLDLFEIARRLAELTERARNGKLSLDEMRNGTFTITNHGVSGSLIATPIINQPQSAILGIGKVEKRPVVVDAGGTDAIQIKPMAYVTLTFDHRALDGFQANTFLSRFVEALQLDDNR